MKRNLLNKKEVLLFYNAINENTVPWDKSALGILTNAVLRPFSLLTGSIKKGLKKQQINNLINQYGLIIVDAIKKVDTGETESESNDTETTEKEKINLTDSEKSSDILKYLKNGFFILTEYIEELKKFNNLDIIDQRDKEFTNLQNKTVSTLEVVNINTFEYIINDYIIKNKLENVSESINNFKILTNNIIESNDVRELINKLGGLNKINEKIKLLIKSCETIQDNFDILHLELTDDPIVESISINENIKEIPNQITNLFPKEFLEKIQKKTNIIKQVTNELNKVKLNRIIYEANFIIQQADEKERAELQRKWDVGIQNIRDYFQTVVDVNVLADLKGEVDQKIKTEIEEDNKAINKLQKMKITETFPVGESFDKNNLYAFECTINGQNNKNLRTILLATPIGNFKEEIGGDNYFWFKVFGGYNIEDKKIIRENIFSKITGNNAMINNFKNDGNSYFFAFRNLQPSNNASNMFVYSNTGKIFFNNRVDDFNKFESDIQQYKGNDLQESLKKIFKIGNQFKITINQRFIIENKNIEENLYPGIDINAIKNDKNSNNAIDNHKKLINTLS